MKRLVSAITVVVILVIGFIVYYTYPREISRTMTGVQYQVGTGHSGVIPVTITIHGKIRRALNGLQTFQGTVDITGATVSNPDNNRVTVIHFDTSGQGEISYGYWMQRTGTLFPMFMGTYS